MNPAEAVALTAVVQAYFPSQPISEFTPDALHELLEPYTLADCKNAVQARALRLTNTEGQKWCAPTDVYAEVRRMRAKAIAEDMELELPPHNPDDPQDYIRALKASRAAALAGDPVQPQELVRRSIRELGGPIRRVNELEDADRAKYAQALREQRAAGLHALADKPDPEPAPAVVFACEVVVDGELCGDPAPHLSPDRRKPLCDDHREPATDDEGDAA